MNNSRHCMCAQLHNYVSVFTSLCYHVCLVRFSEGGCLLSYDTKGIVHLLDSTHYCGLSWIPVLDTSYQTGWKPLFAGWNDPQPRRDQVGKV